jgi:hypothetical protein
MPSTSRHLTRAPAELTAGKLRRLGEGIGKVVYASEHWVVKRERSDQAILALIVIWRWLRPVRSTRRLRVVRLAIEAVLRLVPKPLWYWTHAGRIWQLYTSRDERGARLAEEILAGTDDLPGTIEFPPVRVRVGGWPGWLTVSEATERVECTFLERLEQLSAAGRWAEIETWLNRLLAFRLRGWGRGLFSVDAHLKNYGVVGKRVVLLDVGGLTDHWEEIEDHLDDADESRAPHRRLGLGELLKARPDVAARFDARWRAAVQIDTVWQVWPKADDENPPG